MSVLHVGEIGVLIRPFASDQRPGRHAPWRDVENVDDVDRMLVGRIEFVGSRY